MLIFITFVIGLLFGFIVRNRMEGGSIIKYLGSPCDQRLELDWAGRQIFRLFSKGMSERWYEARAYLNQGIFFSLLAAFHLIHIVRIDYETSRDSYVSFVIFKVHGFQSIADLKSKMPKWIEEKKAQAKDAKYYHQTFVCGHNVISDYMSGDLAAA
jgi:hypothetical protein